MAGFDTSILPICKDSLGWMFNKLDMNYDLLLDHSEINAIYLDKYEPCIKPLFNSCDSFKDGKLSNNEWCYCFQKPGGRRQAGSRAHDSCAGQDHILGRQRHEEEEGHSQRIKHSAHLLANSKALFSYFLLISGQYIRNPKSIIKESAISVFLLEKSPNYIVP